MRNAALDAKFYHALNVATSCGYRTLEKLKQQHETWEAAWNAFAPSAPKLDAETLWNELMRMGISCFLAEDSHYPAHLREIPFAPHAIYCKGSETALNTPGLAIIGTRKAGAQSERLAHQCAGDVSRAGLPVVSGLAFGIDAAAHRGALSAHGTTIAVLPCGLDRIYPRSNERLASEILDQGGVLVSELPPRIPIFAYHFLQRNRIVSGLSRACFFVEVPSKSGSLATARFALDQNRDILVVPGAVWDTHYVGSNKLIQQGATLITSSHELLSHLGLAETPDARDLLTGESEDEQKIIATLKNSAQPLSVDKIAEFTKLNIQTVLETTSLLLFQNKIKEADSGFML